MSVIVEGDELRVEDQDRDGLRLFPNLIAGGAEGSTVAAVHAYSASRERLLSVHLTAEDARAMAAWLLKAAGEDERPVPIPADPIAVVERLRVARDVLGAIEHDYGNTGDLLNYLLTGNTNA